MAIGDYMIRRNDAETTTITTTAATLTWDTDYKTIGTGITYSAGQFTLVAAGVYLIIWNERFEETSKVTDSTNRIEVNGHMQLDTGGGFNTVENAKCQGYIRQDSGQFQIVIRGATILRTTGANHKVQFQAARTDNSADTCNRDPDNGAVQIIRLDESDLYGRYRSTSGQTLTADTETGVTLGATDEEDSPYTRTGSAIDIATAGRYLCCFSADISMTYGNRSEIVMWLELDAVEVPGSRNQVYLRGTDGTQDGAISGICLLDVTAGEDLTWRVARVEGGTTTTIASGACLQLWQLPTGNKTVIMEATTGTMLGGQFAWDTLPHIDTSNFTATAGNSNIDTDSAVSTFLCIAGGARTSYGSCARTTVHYRIESESHGVLPYGGDSSYFRGSGTAGYGGGSAAVIVPDHAAGSLYMNTDLLGTASSTNTVCQSGQFAVIDLGALYTYTYPPVITDLEDEILATDEEDVLLDGLNFGATQGNGKLEIGSAQDYSGTNVTQTINTWGDAQIDFDVVQGALSEGVVFAFVTTDGGERSTGYMFILGWPPYEPQNNMVDKPDHYWEMDNAYTDTGAQSSGTPRPFNNVQTGTPDFVTTPICRTNTHSFRINQAVESSEVADSPYTNITNAHARRRIGGWLRMENEILIPGTIYEEGGGVNCLYFVIGYGLILIANAEDDGDFSIQAFADFPLTIGRPYHIMMALDCSSDGNEFYMLIDGVKQALTSGNPPGVGTMVVHSGDFVFGDADGALQTGGQDIGYAAGATFLLAHWGTWSKVGAGIPSDTEIRDDLFREGALADDSITSGTQSAMQTAIEAYDSSTRPDWPLSYEINGVTGGGDLELTITDQVFDDGITLHVRWLGGGTLTIRNSGTSNFDATKVHTPNGGTVAVIETAAVEVAVKDISDQSALTGARALLLANTGGPLPASDSVSITRSGSTATVTHTAHGLLSGAEVQIDGAAQEEYNGVFTVTVTGVNAYTYTVVGTPTSPATGSPTSTAVVLSGTTDGSGEIKGEIDYTSSQPVTGRVRSASGAEKYQQGNIAGTIGATGLTTTVFLVSDE